MSIREFIPASVLVAARLARTKLTIAGLRDVEEKTARESTAAALAALPRATACGRRVLVFSLRGGWYPHTAWEALLARGFDLRGCEVHLFNCGGPMPICEVNFRHADPAVACTECAAYPDVLARQFALSRSWLRDYVHDDEIAAIRREVASLDDSACAAWTFNGQPIGVLVRNSVLWFLRKSRVEAAGDQRVYRDFLIAGAQIAVMAPRLIAAVRPDVVVELNGLFFAEQIFNQFVPGSTRLITYEAGWRSNTLGFDDFSERGFVDVDEPWQRLRDQPLTGDESARLDSWIRSRGGGDMQRDFYVQFDAADSEHPLTRLGLDPALPTALLFTNLVWDTAVLGRDIAFSSLQDWLLETLAWFKVNPQRQLVIRIHPAEQLRPSQESREKVADLLDTLSLPRNVRVVSSSDPLSSYRLIDAAACVLVYNSTTGLEAALRGRTVVVAARVYYADRGFTLDVKRRADYPSILAGALDGQPLAASQIDIARRFANLLLYRFLHDIPVVKQRPRTLPLLAADEVPLVAAGADSPFDALLGRMLAGQPLV